ncbi:hypothetical protein DL96DRAFT_1688084 [Flagelloscypha sp. PMI_526]|nr:hypothetical protein DL96DRAFT_1688084 [Flagelloscypha sp. PMI_526]
MVPVELLKEILAHCAKSDLARASMANSQLLEISRDSLYSKVFVWGDATLTPILPALRNPSIAQRLRHLLLDPTYVYESSHLEEFLDIIASSSLIRLDLIPFNGIGYSPAHWKQLLLVRFTQCRSLQYLKLSLGIFVDYNFTSVLPAKALQDLDISDPRLLRHYNGSSESSLQTTLPILDTLRIRGGPHCRKLLKVLDLTHLKRLGIWDFEQETGDLANEWGGLVTTSAGSLESLSLWLTPNIIFKDIPKYLESTSGFPNLHTLSLFITIQHGGPPLFWMHIFPPIFRVFHACSPSLRHIRLYPYTSITRYSYGDLLKGQVLVEIAHEVRELRGLETIEFSFLSPPLPSSHDRDTKLGQLAEMFHPVRLFIQYGDDRKEPEWTRILDSP